MAGEFQVSGKNAAALFTLKLHRGDGMALLAMNWKKGKPPKDFVGFAIEYKDAGRRPFFALKNRLAFPGAAGAVNPNRLSTMLSPIQKFRWVHFPRNANLDGEFIYRVTPMFMNDARQAQLRRSAGSRHRAPARNLSRPAQRHLHPRLRVVAGLRRPLRKERPDLTKLHPGEGEDGLNFKPTHPDAKEALAWMGFEAREAILEVLDEAIKDKAEVRVVAYDLNEPDMVDAAREARQAAEDHHRRQTEHGEPESARIAGGEAPRAPRPARRTSSAST